MIVCLCCFSLSLLLFVIRSHRTQKQLTTKIDHANYHLSRLQSHTNSSRNLEVSKSPDILQIPNIQAITPEHSPQHSIASEPEPITITSKTPEPPSVAALKSSDKPPIRRVRSYSARDSTVLPSNHLVITHQISKSNLSASQQTTSSIPPSPLAVPVQPPSPNVLKPVLSLQLISDRRGSEMSGISSIPPIPDDNRHDTFDVDGHAQFNDGHGQSQQPLQQHMLNPTPLTMQQSASMQSVDSSVISLPPQAITPNQQWKQQMWQLQQQMMGSIPDLEHGTLSQQQQHQLIPSGAATMGHQVTESIAASEMSMVTGSGDTGSGDTNSGSSSSSGSDTGSSGSGDTATTMSAVTAMSSVSQHRDHHKKVIIMMPEESRKGGHAPKASISGLPIVCDVQMEDTDGRKGSNSTLNEDEESSTGF